MSVRIPIGITACHLKKSRHNVVTALDIPAQCISQFLGSIGSIRSTRLAGPGFGCIRLASNGIYLSKLHTGPAFVMANHILEIEFSLEGKSSVLEHTIDCPGRVVHDTPTQLS